MFKAELDEAFGRLGFARKRGWPPEKGILKATGALRLVAGRFAILSRNELIYDEHLTVLIWLITIVSRPRVSITVRPRHVEPSPAAL